MWILYTIKFIKEKTGFFCMTVYQNEIPLLAMTRKRTDVNRNIAVIEETFSPLENQRILDIGCGRGGLLKALANRSAKPTGIDVNKQSLIEASKKCPQAELFHTGAGDMVFSENGFDGTIILNTLHHIPEQEVQKGLLKALQVTKPGCPLLIMEPLNFGSFFEVLKPLEDETEVCRNALHELHDFIEGDLGRLDDAFEYMISIRVNGIEAIVNDAVSVDPNRANRVEMVIEEMKDLFQLHALKKQGYLVLEQPMVAFVLTK